MLGPDGIAIPDDLIDEIAERGLTVDPTLGFDPTGSSRSTRRRRTCRAVVERVGMTPVEIA